MAAVLYVDPDDEHAGTVADELDAAGVDTVRRAGTIADAVTQLEANGIDCVVTEYELPDGTGFDLVHRVREVTPNTVCLLYTALDPDAIPTEGETRVLDCYFTEHTEPADLASMIETAVELRSHTAYPLPSDEDQRLATLESLDLDSARLRRAVERVTDLAARHFGVERASVNLIEADTQTFFACHGADWTSTARDESICTYAIVNEDPVTVIEDTAEDPRFEDNDVLRALGIRFYAGADVVADGHAVGTLCVYGEAPVSFDQTDREYLSLLADEVGHLLTVHRDLALAERSEGSA